MQTIYEVGKTYDLTVVSTIVKDGSPYIVVTDEEHDYTVRPYDYQIEYSSIPDSLSCFVKNIGLSGKPCFEQTKESVLKDRYYQFGVFHTFTIGEVSIDNKTRKTFYVLSDEYGITHRYYPGDEEIVKKSGDSISLKIKRIVPAQVGRNNARLDFEPAETGVKSVSQSPRPVFPKNAGKKCFGSEDEKREFKSSIVYPAGETGPDIDTQLGIICRTIAGFMNAKGGTLYIGVSDNGYVCGIEGDYQHLNDGEEEFVYKEDDDHYMMKITNRICKLLGRTAGTLIGMRIEKEDEKKYCVIEIQKASRPIWFEGNKLFVRIVTTNRKLLNDEITQFVLDRVSKTSFLKQKETEGPVTADVSEESSETTTPSPVPPVPIVAPAPITVVKASKPSWRFITFYKNGDWSFQKNELTGDDVVCSVNVPGDAKRYNYILILAYENGHVEATYLKEVLYGKNGLLPEGSRRGHGLCLANGRLVSAFCTNKKDMLLLVSDIAGNAFVKAVDVDTLGIHNQMGKGNGIVRENGATLQQVVHIPENANVRFALQSSGIFIEKNQKYTKGGVSIIALTPDYKKFIESYFGSEAA